jgi:aminopeptidase N
MSFIYSGLYLGEFIDISGEKQYLLSTQFEPTGARMVFPCFDEPALKAKFQFSMTYKYSEYSAIFNMGIKESIIDGDWTTNKYEGELRINIFF